MATGAIPRPTARLLVTDNDDRLLLFHCRMSLDRPDELCWATPGGGVRPGESVAEAAVRELREETGIVATTDSLGPVVAYTTGEWSADGTVFAAHDSFFWYRAGNPVISPHGRESLERFLLVGHRWWSAAELAAVRGENMLLPVGVAGLLRDLTAGRVPSAPVRLPWRADQPD